MFRYPAHKDPAPTFCRIHDPNPDLTVDFGNITPVEPEPALPGVDGANYQNYQNSDYQNSGLTSGFIPDLVPDFKAWLLTEQNSLVYPQGNSFVDSPKLRSAEAIRADYMQRIEAVQAPEITPIDLPLPKHGNRVSINHLGDVHIGTDACTYFAFKEMLDYILNTDDEYLALQGDMVDLLTGSSVGVMAEQALTIQDQFTLATDDLLPLARARKILWMLRGNHEDRLDKATKNVVDATQTMARHLDVRYLQTENYTQVRCGGSGYTSYNIHGFNTGPKPATRRNKMESMLQSFRSADIITSGHTHQLDVIQIDEDIINPLTRRRENRTRYGLFTGTFHSYMGYAADFGLKQGPLGCGRVEFNIEYGTILPRVLPVRRVNGKYRMELP